MALPIGLALLMRRQVLTMFTIGSRNEKLAAGKTPSQTGEGIAAPRHDGFQAMTRAARSKVFKD